MQQVEKILDELDLEGRGVVPPREPKDLVRDFGVRTPFPEPLPEPVLAARREERKRRKTAFDDRLWGKRPDRAETGRDGPVLDQIEPS